MSHHNGAHLVFDQPAPRPAWSRRRTNIVALLAFAVIFGVCLGAAGAVAVVLAYTT